MIIATTLLYLLFVLRCLLLGWALHRNFRPYRYPTDWDYNYPFKASDTFALTIVKGIATSLVAGLIPGCAWLLGWYLSADGWSLATFMLIDLNFCFLLFDKGLTFPRLRWWCFYLNSAARNRLRLSWMQDGYSAF